MEQVLLTVRETFVYRPSKLRNASGHRAQDWDLAHPVFTGCLRVFRRDRRVDLRVYTYANPEAQSQAGPPLGILPDSAGDAAGGEGEGGGLVLFAECPVVLEGDTDEGPGDRNRVLTDCVQPVVDSSRYFVLRCVDRGSEEQQQRQKTAYIGIGFRERQDAFDLRAALQDFVKSVGREDQAAAMGGGGLADSDGEDGDDAAAATEPYEPSNEFQLAEGEKIHVALKSSGGRRKRESSGDKATPGLLAPPPAPGSVVPFVAPAATTSATTASAAAGSADAEGDDDEDWGDFAHA